MMAVSITRISLGGGRRGRGEITRRSEVSETSFRPVGEQERRTWTAADVLSVLRVPMAVAFVLVSNEWWRLAIVALAGLTDLLDGRIARRYGSSRLGPIVDPIADKLFMACAFGVVAFSGRLEWYELVGVLLRDIIATIAFAATAILGRAVAVPARAGGKAVTVAQLMTLVAVLTDSPRLRPRAWATAAIGLYAIWDYERAARARPVT
jgi:CDP-diacylglycerol--glycerol-3-phosphate 3-phosphatidyltransferase/cardiolipin synthase